MGMMDPESPAGFSSGAAHAQRGAGWRVRVDCRDCTGANPAGCFGGGYGWVVRDEAGRFDVDDRGEREQDGAVFGSEREASSAWQEVDAAGPWEATIVKVEP
jgi:hypothetical protein